MGWLKQRNSNESRCEPRKLCVGNLLEDLGTNYLAFVLKYTCTLKKWGKKKKKNKKKWGFKKLYIKAKKQKTDL